MLKPFENLLDTALNTCEKQFTEALSINANSEETHVNTKTKYASVDYDESKQYMCVSIFKNITLNDEITVNKGSKIRTLENGNIDAYVSFELSRGHLYNSIAKAVDQIGIQKLQDGFYQKHKKDNFKLQIKINKNVVILHLTGTPR